MAKTKTIISESRLLRFYPGDATDISSSAEYSASLGLSFLLRKSEIIVPARWCYRKVQVSSATENTRLSGIVGRFYRNGVVVVFVSLVLEFVTLHELLERMCLYMQ